MKWVVITLLLLNGIFLAVQFNKPDETSPAVERFPFSGPPLMLVSEQQKEGGATVVAESRPGSQLAQAEAEPTPAPQPQPQSKPQPPAPAAAEKPVAQAEPITAPPAPKPKPVPKRAPASTPTSNALACYSVGPFLLLSDVRGVSQLLNYGDVVVSERSEAQRKQVGYWVYIPPQETLLQAREAMRRMKENGIADALIISEGSKANAISVGVYQTEALGKERQQALQGLGFQAKLEPLFRTQPQYWLEVELMKSTQIPDKLWREVTAGYPNIQQLRRKCD